VLKFAMDRIRVREEERRDDPERKGHERDFLGRFLDIRDKDPNIPDSYARNPIGVIWRDGLLLTTTQVDYQLGELEYPGGLGLDCHYIDSCLVLSP
jgi:hypothetical protein